VHTQVAIALGASVHPLTRITPSVRRAVMSSAGFERALETKSRKLTFVSPLYNRFCSSIVCEISPSPNFTASIVKDKTYANTLVVYELYDGKALMETITGWSVGNL